MAALAGGTLAAAFQARESMAAGCTSLSCPLPKKQTTLLKAACGTLAELKAGFSRL